MPWFVPSVGHSFRNLWEVAAEESCNDTTRINHDVKFQRKGRPLIINNHSRFTLELAELPRICQIAPGRGVLRSAHKQPQLTPWDTSRRWNWTDHCFFWASPITPAISEPFCSIYLVDFAQRLYSVQPLTIDASCIYGSIEKLRCSSKPANAATL